MEKYIALLRGINVGGHNRLPMKELVRLLEERGLHKVKTYIQTGNLIFRSEKSISALSSEIKRAIEEKYHFAPHVHIFTFDEYESALSANPFKEAENDPKKLHLFFLDAEPPNPDLAYLADIRQEGEQFLLKNKVFYFYAPEGVGRSKVAARAEKALGVPATARNWRTADKIRTLAAQLS